MSGEDLIYREVFLDEHEYPARIWDGDSESYVNPDPALWGRLEEAEEQFAYNREAREE